MELTSTIFVLFLCVSLDYGLPIDQNNDIPLEVKAMQNPRLFGGDIMGIDLAKLHNRNAVPDKNKLWAMGVIPFVIDGNLADQRQQILNAMNEYHENTCIRFVERKDEYDYIHISRENGCYSYVGRLGGQQLVSLGNGCYSKGTIVHELGHAVGFYHEHQRSDRDDYLDIIKENIKPGLEDQFYKLSPSENQLLVSFDFSSVMLYGPLTFSKDSHSKTMVPNARHRDEVMLEVYQKYGLSKTDITAIQKLYQCQ